MTVHVQQSSTNTTHSEPLFQGCLVSTHMSLISVTLLHVWWYQRSSSWGSPTDPAGTRLTIMTPKKSVFPVLFSPLQHVIQWLLAYPHILFWYYEVTVSRIPPCQAFLLLIKQKLMPQVWQRFVSLATTPVMSNFHLTSSLERTGWLCKSQWNGVI